MSDASKEFMDRHKMQRAGVTAVVQVTLSVETGVWGVDCKVEQVVAQAIDSAMGKVRKAIHSDKDIRLLAADAVHVVTKASLREEVSNGR